ncbi:hypothetical protein ACLB2K_014806 [Fragaria x ananassa]
MIRPRRSTDEGKSPSFRANVPFSWERKPGMSKLKLYSSDRRSLDHYFTTTTSSLKLIPPPARLSSQLSATSSPAGHRQSRGGPCLCSSVDVQPPVATTFRNSFRLTSDASLNPLQEDPFLAASIKCTQMHSSGITNSGRRYAADYKHAAGFSARKKNIMFSMFSAFSCKYSALRNDDVVVTMPRESFR